MTTQADMNGREMVISRLLHAPRELVFDVWTDANHVANWFGPDGFTITTHEHEVKPNGIWKFMMHGPDGRNYPNKIIFMEVVRPERLTYRHAGDEDTEPVNFHVTVTFEERDGKTLLTMRSVFESEAELQRVNKVYGALEGGKQTIGRMAEYLEKLKSLKTLN